ncbi:aspartate-semialdehyde dehydrogenase [Seleniivibrio woodruffii]|uniref:Aspartate-semialdehyde dehydrogenase n=1 Tax=Seleniivibrio woodruffii TaxID=1078050 RepID=A0A4V2PRY2_9BACT|nr:aspartate-semialdehyde dehydrogenase [Seleniivibrio woodruffii]TCK60571.1 aspartate-semialdehyde dehydrogenase [Seleniivibrio woodruffii]TVZ36200.1 aspartate-semialdehyde dehydrogenase [Seleniivibrio woodruffii]
MAELKKKAAYNVAIAGATGAVGETFLQILEERNFPIAELKLLASKRSVGKELTFKGKTYKVEELTHDCFEGVDIALFSAGGGRSLEYAPSAVKAGAVVIDNSSAYRMDKDVPLVVPEVNPEDAFKHKGIIANPNCTTIIMLVALKPLYDYSKVKSVVVSSYQSTSGAGAQAMEELMNQTKAWAKGEDITVEKFAHQILFNVIPHVDSFTDNGYTKEEMKMFNETRKMLHDDEILVSATCVRVPTLSAHSESVTIETVDPISPEKARELFAKAPGLQLLDDPSNNKYPMPLFVAGGDDCFVGRIRTDISRPNSLAFWVVGDQLRKGAATNAVQIAELLIK